jgi:FAD:protein FMN transferase
MPERRFRRSAPVMGTVATIELADADGTDAARLADDVFGWLHEVDRRFSPYRRDSEINRLDRGELRLDECHDDVREVIAACADLWQDTDGYFDVYATGRLDPCGFVKGWSVQVASERLTAAGATNHLVDAGGDVQARGYPEPGQLWRVGIRHPWDPTATCAVVTGGDLAVATSGTYERGRHVVDPRSGRLVGDLRSVTVVGRDLGVADAYATAAMAMRDGALSWLATLPGHESLVVDEAGRCFRSDGFPGPAGPLDENEE